MGNRIARRAGDVQPRTSSIYPPEFRGVVEGRAKRALGDLFGLDQFGVNLTELAPGAASSLLHWHSAEDEMVYILTGTPTLVSEGVEEVLQPGDCAGYKAGVAVGHCLVNRTSEPVTYIEIGSRRIETDRCEYPGIDMLVEPDGGGRRRLVRRDGTPY